MAIPTDTLPELNFAAAFLQCADSPRAKAHLRAKLRRIRKAHRAGDPQLPYLIQKYLTSYDARIAASRLAAKKMPWYRRPKETELKSIAKSSECFSGDARRGQAPTDPEKREHVSSNIGLRERAPRTPKSRALGPLCRRRTAPAAIRDPWRRTRSHRRGRERDESRLCPCDRDRYQRLLRELRREQAGGFGPGSEEGDRENIASRAPEYHHQHIPPYHSPPFGPANTDPGEAPFEKYLADARRGIPQGPAASPILAEMLLAPLLFPIPPGGQLVAYADNVLLMAKNKSDADAMTESFGSALKKHPAGQLWPKIKSFSAGGPIDFLGHRLTAHGDEVRVQPTPENREKFERKMKTDWHN